MRTPILPQPSFEKDATEVLGELKQAFSALLDAVPNRPRNGTEVSRAFEVDKALGWNTYRISSAPHPMAAGIRLPASVSVRRLLQSAAKKNIPQGVITRVSDALARVDRLVELHTTDRSEFEALIAWSMPEEREKASLRRREVAYEAARDIRGIAKKTSLYSAIFYPSRQDPAKLDAARIDGWIDLRRLRKGTTIKAHMIATRAIGGEDPTTIDGHPITEGGDVLLKDYSSNFGATLAARKIDPHCVDIEYLLHEGGVGATGAVNLVWADVLRNFRNRYSGPEATPIASSSTVEHPSQWKVMDILVYEGIAAKQRPTCRVYDLVPYGIVKKYDDPSREDDIVDFEPSSRYLGKGLDNFGCVHVPHYLEVLSHVCDRQGWDASKLHGYRMEIEYPVYSWQIQMKLAMIHSAAPTA